MEKTSLKKRISLIEKKNYKLQDELKFAKEQLHVASFKKGMYVKYIANYSWVVHPTNVFKIKGISLGKKNMAKGKYFIRVYADKHTHSRASNHIEYFRPATKSEIKSHIEYFKKKK